LEQRAGFFLHHRFCFWLRSTCAMRALAGGGPGERLRRTRGRHLSTAGRLRSREDHAGHCPSRSR